ncbi:MAG TPA: hypothetical protein PKD53_10565 [Chloroflexaceae bacterium]|nr:hypothetical protein [Chloroflexaceae bacterium]
MTTPARLCAMAGLLCLVAALLAAPPAAPLAAAGLAAVCADGAVLWANNRSRPETLVISGSNSTFGGAVRSNADLRISGSDNTIAGAVRYATAFEDGGDANRYPAPARAAPADPALRYAVADYRPGGRAAAAAAAAGVYRYVAGDLDISEPRVLSGLYYVTGDAKLSASDLRGAVTVVAEGTIDVSGSLHQLGPYADGLLLLSNQRAVGDAVIKLAGSNSTLRGAIVGLGGQVELSGGDLTTAGPIVGDTLEVSGSDLRLAYSAEYCRGQPAPAPNRPFRVMLPYAIR